MSSGWQDVINLTGNEYETPRPRQRRRLTGANSPPVIDLTGPSTARRPSRRRSPVAVDLTGNRSPNARRSPRDDRLGPSTTRRSPRDDRPGPSRRRSPVAVDLTGNRSPNARVVRPAELPHARRTSPNRASPPPPRFQVRFGELTLKPHQLNVSRLFVQPRVPGVLLYFKVGSGKTLASVAAAENLAHTDGNHARPVLVVVPAGLKKNYEDAVRAAGVRNPGRYEVVSYQMAARNASSLRQRFADGVLIMDEAHTVRNAGGKTVQAMLRLSGAVHKRLLLTGTPVVNYPLDVAPLLALLDPARNAELLRLRRREDVVPRPGERVKAVTEFELRYGKNGDKRPAELDGLFACVSLFYEPGAQEVRRHYPSKTEREVRVDMNEAQIREHYDLLLSAKDLPDEFDDPDDPDGEDAEARSVTFLTRPRMVALSNSSGASPKMDIVVRRLERAVREGRKAIVYFQHLENGLLNLSRRLDRAFIPYGQFHGSVTKTRDDDVSRYNQGRVRILLLSSAGAEGLDLKRTSEVHILQPEWNEERINQVVGRAVRYGSHANAGDGERHVTVYRYVSVLPPDAMDVLAPEVRFEVEQRRSRLVRESADQILQDMSARKHAVNQAFLRRLVAVSDRNVARCIGQRGSSPRVTPPRRAPSA